MAESNLAVMQADYPMEKLILVFIYNLLITIYTQFFLILKKKKKIRN